MQTHSVPRWFHGLPQTHKRRHLHQRIHNSRNSVLHHRRIHLQGLRSITQSLRIKVLEICLLWSTSFVKQVLRKVILL